MRADDTDAGASQGGLMPPVMSRPGARAVHAIPGGSTIAPPSVWRPTGVSAQPTEAEAAPIAVESQTAVEPEAEKQLELEPVANEPTEAPAADDSFEPWAEAAVTETESPAVTEAPALAEGAPEIEASTIEAIAAFIEVPTDQELATAEQSSFSEEPYPAEEPDLNEMASAVEEPVLDEAAITEEPWLAEEPTPFAEEFAVESFFTPEVEAPPVEEEIDESAPEAESEESAAATVEDLAAQAAEEEVEAEAAADAPDADIHAAVQGVDLETVAAHTDTPAHELAERLQKVAQNLQTDKPESVIRGLAAGDRLDALLAGLLAGFLARPGE